jgi:hypothetical protein
MILGIISFSIFVFITVCFQSERLASISTLARLLASLWLVYHVFFLDRKRRVYDNATSASSSPPPDPSQKLPSSNQPPSPWSEPSFSPGTPVDPSRKAK